MGKQPKLKNLYVPMSMGRLTGRCSIVHPLEYQSHWKVCADDRYGDDL